VKIKQKIKKERPRSKTTNQQKKIKKQESKSRRQRSKTINQEKKTKSLCSVIPKK